MKVRLQYYNIWVLADYCIAETGNGVRHSLPMVNVVKDLLGLGFGSGSEVDVLLDPVDKVVFECSFDELME